MKIQCCSAGHYYDAELYPSCPECNWQKDLPGKALVCPSCGTKLGTGDRFCRLCGARCAAPPTVPIEFACVYGPAPEVYDTTIREAPRMVDKHRGILRQLRDLFSNRSR